MNSISVIIPTYNAQDTISDTINSVVRQTFPVKEIIVVDDCSTDQTFQTVLTLKNTVLNLVAIQTKDNFGGPAGPRNLGLDNATGKYVAFLDADDLWHPKLLESYSKFLKNNFSMLSSSKFSFKDPTHFFKQEISIENVCKRSTIKSTWVTYDDLLNQNYIANSSVLIERAKINTFRFEIGTELVAVEDFIAWCYVHKQFGPSLKLDLKMLGYRVSSGSLSSNKLKMLSKRISALRFLGLSNLQIFFRIIKFILLKVVGARYE